MAEEANQLKSSFLSTVSHELRTPLSLIVGLSEIVLREQKEHPDAPQVNVCDVKQINISAQHLARLIGDVLDLASSGAGQSDFLHFRAPIHMISPTISECSLKKLLSIDLAVKALYKKGYSAVSLGIAKHRSVSCKTDLFLLIAPN